MAAAPPDHPRSLRVFLCHSSDDKAQVRELYKRLLSEGIDPWLDEEKLLPGQDWQLEIARALRASDLIIVCLSRGSITREGFVQKEIRQALDVADEKPDGTIFLIPLKLEPCDVPDRLRRWQWIDLFESNGYQHLLRSLDSRASAVDARLPLAPTKGAGSSSSSVSPEDRILQLMHDATNKTLWVKGLSLRAFFRDGDLYDAIYQACRREADVKVLLIDPNSEQARMRFHLEYTRLHSSKRLEDFTPDEMKRGMLYLDTLATIDKIRQLSAELNAMGFEHTFEARLFTSAAEAFMLITDQAALVEPYHYGKLKLPDAAPAILLNSMPLIEYNRMGNERPESDPYRMLKEHFEFVFVHHSKTL